MKEVTFFIDAGELILFKTPECLFFIPLTGKNVINFALIGICIIAGMLFRRSKTLPADAHKGINAWIIYIALPALSLKYLPHIQWSTHLLLAALAPVIVWFGGWLYCSIYFSKSG